MTPEAGPAVWDELAAHPGRYDLFQALRRIEAAHPGLPRLGDAVRPADEPVRFAGDPALDFAPAAIARLERPAGRVPRLVQRVLGLFGPNGALPVHLTEYARERALHHGDRSVAAFADMLLHRFGLFFYRAWARAQPGVGLDRGKEAPIVRQVGALIGLAEPALQDRDALGDWAKLHFAGRLARPVRDADGLASWIRLRFGVAAEVQQFAGHWMALHPEERTRVSGLSRQAGGQPGPRRGAGAPGLGRAAQVPHRDRPAGLGAVPGLPARRPRPCRSCRRWCGSTWGWSSRGTCNCGCARPAVPAWPPGPAKVPAAGWPGWAGLHAYRSRPHAAGSKTRRLLRSPSAGPGDAQPFVQPPPVTR